MENGITNNNATIRRAHSEEMLSEIDLNLIGTSANGREVDPKKQPQNASVTTNQKPQNNYHQNGGFSSTELEEEDDVSPYRYKQQGQALCVSDIPRMRRNSDRGGPSAHEERVNVPQQISTSGEMVGSYSLQYEPQHNYEFERSQGLGISNEFRHMSIVNNGHNSSTTASPLATSEQIFLSNGILKANSSLNNTCSLRPLIDSSGNEQQQQQSGFIDIETTQLNPDLCSLQSNEDVDVMMTSSASLQLHHLHQYNQNLEVSSR